MPHEPRELEFAQPREVADYAPDETRGTPLRHAPRTAQRSTYQRRFWYDCWIGIT